MLVISIADAMTSIRFSKTSQTGIWDVRRGRSVGAHSSLGFPVLDCGSLKSKENFHLFLLLLNLIDWSQRSIMVSSLII